MNVSANNTLLSNFAFVNRLNLLKDVFGKVYLTPEIQYKVEKGILEGHVFQERTKQIIETKDWLLVTGFNQDEQKLFDQLTKTLDVGEASCLAIAKLRKWIFLTDDKDARKAAERLAIELSGTIGFLRLARDKKLITSDEANALLQSMIANGYYSPVRKLDDSLINGG
jgi:predicted nucleic acid-binding protein